jgi:GPH family glycoside/pentoside/hexuronide:cation symporter
MPSITRATWVFNLIWFMQERSLPLKKQVIYAFGMMGWSVMINLINVILVYVYAPPSNSGMPILISQAAIFGIFNVIAIITASGRFADAVIDPMIGQLSDRSANPKGRRIPFMKRAILPSMVFCFLIFYPLHRQESPVNTIWLVLVLIGFYVSTTTYIIPYNALLPEMAHGSHEKVKLATWQSVGYVFGMAIGSNAFNITDLLQNSFGVASRLTALQYTVAMLAMLAGSFMAVTAWSINEKEYSAGKPSAVPIFKALRQTLTNRNFLFFIVADFSFFLAVTIISSGILYFVTVLLQLPETIGNKLIIGMVLLSFIFYPVVSILSKKIGKKPIVVVSLLLLAAVFAGIYFLGKPDIDARVQIYSLVILAAIPVASLNILPVAILAEVIAEDTRKTGANKEAIYFAVRYFFVKIAQTVGIALFAIFLIHGKDVGHDFGIRLNGLLGFILCLVAALVFLGFKEVRPAAIKK